MDRAEKKLRRQRFLFLIAAGILLFFSLRWLTAKNTPVISPIPDTEVAASGQVTKPKTFTLFQKQKKPDDLLKKVQNVVGDAWTDYSIDVEDYTSDFSARTSEGEIFVAASVNKIPILAALYALSDKGEVDLDRDITVQPADIQDYGTGSIRYDSPGSVYSVKTLAKLMIKQSDNTAAYIIANHIIGFDKLTAIVSEWGLSQTDMVANKTSNQDMAKLFRMIYERKIAKEAPTLEMLSFLKDTDYETRIPGALPDEATVYHKIGTEIGAIHDAGIVTDGKHTYYIGIFTNGAAEGEETDQLMAKVAKTVYEYMK